MFPMVFQPVVDSRFLLERIRQLEQALVLQAETIQVILQRLETKFGKGFLGSDLHRLTATLPDAEAKAILNSIDSSIKNGDKPAATRQVRDAFGCTWDEALSAIAEWSSHSFETKIRALRLARYVTVAESIHSSPTETS
ncbi:MAG: hypothetical protein WCJ09_19515 [Planctomycetota bacterium]